MRNVNENVSRDQLTTDFKPLLAAPEALPQRLSARISPGIELPPLEIK